MRIAVIGTYNSGSSALAQVLYRLGVDMGVDMGAPFWCSSDENAENNFWEPYDMVQKLHEIVHEPSLLMQAPEADLRTYLRAWIEMREAIGRPKGIRDFGAKHPILSLFGGLIKEAWGQDTLFLWSRRNINDTKKRFKGRFSWFDGHEDDMIDNLITSLNHFEKHNRVFKVEWNSLFGMRNEAERLIRQIGSLLTNSPTEQQIQSAISCISVPQETVLASGW